MLFNYTTELRTFFENLPANADQSLPHSTVIENGRLKLFDFDYPIFDEDYKKVFETHFIRKFYMRQIGFDTMGLFKFQLETWLLVNMPYFNKLFESELIKFDPLTNTKVDVTNNKTNVKKQTDEKSITDTKSIERETNTNTNRTGTTDNEQTESTAGNTETTNTKTNTKNESGNVVDDNFKRNLESNNPDTRLALTANDGQGVIEYASGIKEENENNSRAMENVATDNGTENGSESNRIDSAKSEKSDITENMTDNSTATMSENDTKNETTNSTINDVEDYVQHRFGKIGIQSFSKMLNEYRSSLLRIENQIFDEMNDLFMMVY